MVAIEHPLVDSFSMRQALGHFPTGVVVITSLHNDVPVGMTLQSFVSLSLDPPLILLSVARSSTTWPLIERSGRFVVNVLAQEQDLVARQFARSGTDKFAGVEALHVDGLGGSVIAGGVAWIDCSVQDEFDGGDHIIVVARVLALECPSRDGEALPPLVFHKSGFQTLAAPAPTATQEKR